MKIRHCCIALLLGLAAMAACSPSVKVVELVETPSPELSAIDSLMWRQPDSALTVMLEFAGSTEADSLDVFNGHYCQVLIAELLYKNYKKQSNRDDVLQAVDYFDSIVAADGYKTDRRKADARGASLRERNVFLDARAHYINGAGFYEQGNVVHACSEYLKAVEVMEEYYEEKALIGKRAVFMFYAHNRLFELFSAQFMMDPALSCGEKALEFCQNEPSLSKEIPNLYSHIGKQYEKKGEKEIARNYYGLATEGLSDINSLVYRDAVSIKALSDYNSGLGADSSLTAIKQVLAYANTEKEKLTRFLTIGVIFTVERFFDSALYYLEPVFENEDNVSLQIQAVEYLLVNYDNLGNKEKSNECTRFLADFKKTEGENKAMVSKLEDLFKEYMNQKQQKEAEEIREKSIKKTIGIIVPIAIMVALAIIVLAKFKSKKLLKKQQEEADRMLGETEQEHEKELRLWQAEADKTLEETKKRYEEELEQLKADTEQQLEEVERKHQQWIAKAKERHEEELRVQKDLSEKEIEKTKKRHEEELETERLAYQKEQEALRQNLQQREAQVSALEKVLEQQSETAAKRRAAFLNEEICQRILDLLHGKHITSRDTSFQHGIGLKEEDFKQLKVAVERHYKGFDNMLLSQCPSLKQSDLSLCHLHLMGLNEGEIGALKDRTYSAIKKQNENLLEKLGVDENISAYVLRIAEGLCGTSNVEQENQLNMDLQRTTEEKPGQPMEMEQESSLKSSLKSLQKILELISASPSITISEIADRLGMTKRGVDKNIKRLKEQGVIRRVGPDKGGHWEVIR